MSGVPRQVRVYADWAGLNGPRLMGHLSMDRVRGKEVFSFEYDGGCPFAISLYSARTEIASVSAASFSGKNL